MSFDWDEVKRRYRAALESGDIHQVHQQMQGVDLCRNCGREPVWLSDTFCGLCKQNLHTQVAEFLSRH